MNNYKIGILAFGSLIDNPGKEINNIEVERIDCETPFKIEFARISSSRDDAPTLLPILDGSKGKKTKAKIIILKDETELDLAKTLLWRRERHKMDSNEEFKDPINPTSKNVLIGELKNFCNVSRVIYTYFLIQKEFENIGPKELAKYAIHSILSEAGKNKNDGIRYLNSAIKAGIETQHSKDYTNEILSLTNSLTLDKAIEKLDNKRESKNKPAANNG